METDESVQSRRTVKAIAAELSSLADELRRDLAQRARELANLSQMAEDCLLVASVLGDDDRASRVRRIMDEIKETSNVLSAFPVGSIIGTAKALEDGRAVVHCEDDEKEDRGAFVADSGLASNTDARSQREAESAVTESAEALRAGAGDEHAHARQAVHSSSPSDRVEAGHPLATEQAKQQSEPEPAPESGGRTVTAPEDAPTSTARPPATPSGRARGHRLLEREQRAFFEDERALLAEGSPRDVLRCKLKAMICRARYLMAKLDVAQDDASAVEQSLRQLGDRLQECGESDFYGLRWARKHPADHWQKAFEGYGWFAIAVEARAWLEARPLSHEDRVRIVDGMAAVESNLTRIMWDVFPGAADSQQRDLHAWIDRDKQDRHIQYWRLPANGGPKNEAVRKAARDFAEKFPSARQECQRLEALIQAQAEVERALEDWETVGGQTEENLQRLKQALSHWLARGGRPTERSIAPRLAPHRHYLDGLTGRQAPNLVRHLDTLLARRAVTETNGEGEAPAEDPEYQANLSRVRAVLAGKRMLFVGGLPREEARLTLEEGLGLERLDWPGSDPTNTPGDFEHAAGRADAVCLLVRFSRHAYKAVLDDAKARGKMTFTLPAGYGLRRVVHDIAEQLRQNQGAVR